MEGGDGTVTNRAYFTGFEAYLIFRSKFRRRPDLSVTFPEECILVDVVVSHPSSPSRISVSALASTRRAENAKVAKYKDIARAEGARVLAFAVLRCARCRHPPDYPSCSSSHGATRRLLPQHPAATTLGDRPPEGQLLGGARWSLRARQAAARSR